MLRKWYDRLGKIPPFPEVAPNIPFTAVGDIHGRSDLLARALAAAPDHQIICVGDYVDRGDNSADVLRMLHARPDIICLSGNHEEMMLRFIKSPETNGARWLRYGGLQTLASFGVSNVTENSGNSAMTRARDDLVEAMGAALLSWLQDLPTFWHNGKIAIVHAGADPGEAIDTQSKRTLHWGHPDFAKTRRADGIWVLHGHTIVDEPRMQNGRISIDTGAYATGRLTAASVTGDGVTFTTVT